MGLRGINHVTFSTSLVDRCVQFYVEVLGCRVLAQWPKGAYLLAGDLWIALVDGADETRLASDYSHIALDASAEELATIVERAQSHGVELWQENWTEGDSLYLLDPAGHRLEVHCTSLLERLVHSIDNPWEGLVISPDAVETVRTAARSG